MIEALILGAVLAPFVLALGLGCWFGLLRVRWLRWRKGSICSGQWWNVQGVGPVRVESIGSDGVRNTIGYRDEDGVMWAAHEASFLAMAQLSHPPQAQEALRLVSREQP